MRVTVTSCIIAFDFPRKRLCQLIFGVASARFTAETCATYHAECLLVAVSTDMTVLLVLLIFINRVRTHTLVEF